MNKNFMTFLACIMLAILSQAAWFARTEANQIRASQAPEYKFTPIGNHRINFSKIDYYDIGNDRVILHFSGGEHLILSGGDYIEFSRQFEADSARGMKPNPPPIVPSPSIAPQDVNKRAQPKNNYQPPTSK